MRKRRKRRLEEGECVTLSQAQQRTVIALAAQREQVVVEANRTLGEIGEALRELVTLYAQEARLPKGDRYDFEQREGAIVLVRKSQAPVVNGRGAAMGVGAVGLDDVEVAGDHGEVGVSEEVAEGEGIALVAEVGDGEGVPEAMGMNVGDAGTVTEAAEKAVEDAGIKGAGVVGGTDDE